MALIGSSARIVHPDLIEKVGGNRLRGDWSLDPVIVAAIEERDNDVIRLKEVYGEYRAGFGRVLTAVAANDPTKTPEAHYLDVNRRAEKWVLETAKRSDVAITSARQTITTLDVEMAERLKVVDGPRGSEIRAYVRSLKKNDRLSALLAAIDSFDNETVGAVLSAPPFLSGLDDKERATLSSRHAEIHAGDLKKRRGALEYAIRINQETLLELMDAQAKLFPKETIAKLSSAGISAQAARDCVYPF